MRILQKIIKEVGRSVQFKNLAVSPIHGRWESIWSVAENAKVAAEAGFQSIECEIDMLGTWFHDPEGVKKQLEKYNMEFAALVLHQDWNGMEENVEEAALSREAIEFVKHFQMPRLC